MWNDNDGHWHMMGGGGAAWGMTLVFLLIVIAGAAALVWVIRDATRTSGRVGARVGERTVDPAAQILRERLARGEIDEREYESRLRLIERDEPAR
jgi:uncharacterized membrane protein